MEADSFTSFYGKARDFRLPGLEKKGLMGSFRVKKKFQKEEHILKFVYFHWGSGNVLSL